MNTKIFEVFEDTLAQKGISIKEIETYVCGEFAQYAFHIKGIKGWRFGLWIDSAPEGNKVNFFAMIEDTIDKFNPSYANDTFKIEAIIVKGNTWWVDDTEKIIKMIKRHPIISYNIDATWDGVLHYRCPHIIKCIMHKVATYKCKIKNWYRYKSYCNITYLWLKVARRRLLKLGLYDSIEIIDNSSNGCWCYPRFELKINCKLDVDIDNDPMDDPLSMMKQWIYSQYDVSGKCMANDISLTPCQDGKVIGWWYDEPREEHFIEVFDWKYKLLKRFRRSNK